MYSSLLYLHTKFSMSKLGFYTRLTARVIQGQIISNATCGSRTHTEVTALKHVEQTRLTLHLLQVSQSVSNTRVSRRAHVTTHSTNILVLDIRSGLNMLKP